jgi:hypothetical protein
MYFCNMKHKPKIIQLFFSTDDTYRERYMIIAELIDGEDPKLHIVEVPAWLVYHSEEYIYYCINLN